MGPKGGGETRIKRRSVSGHTNNLGKIRLKRASDLVRLRFGRHVIRMDWTELPKEFGRQRRQKQKEMTGSKWLTKLMKNWNQTMVKVDGKEKWGNKSIHQPISRTQR